ncbi:MAG: replicative DNA helicase [Clostridia bacterium]|nr:replicative DNA helicase [Clostridia bacterium]
MADTRGKTKEKVKKDPRVLPHSIEAEQCVLGCAFIDQDAGYGIASTLKPDDFYSITHKIIFETMYKLFSANTPIDFITVTESLEKNGELDSVGGVDYLTTLTNVVPSASNYQHYMEIVKNNSVLRQLISAGQDIINGSYGDVDREDALTQAEQMIFKIGEKDERGGLTHINVAVNNAISNFEVLQKNKGQIRGVPSGIYGLDKITNGFQKGALILIAARPGCGKTSLGMNIINHAAVKCGKKAAIFSLEMSKEEIASRSICSLAFVDMGNALKGEMNDKEWKAVLSASKRLSEANIYIDEGFSKSPIDILSKCRKLKREKGLDVLMIDYLQLMAGNKKSSQENRTQEISEITRTLKMAARELEIPIILLSQLSRQSEGRKDHRPILSDLRESGSIEQDADMVLFIYRGDMYNDVPEAEREAGIAEIIIAKNRAGKCDTIKTKWVGSITSFLNLEKDANAMSLEENAPLPPEPRGESAPQEPPVLQEDEELIPLPDEPKFENNEPSPSVDDVPFDVTPEEMVIRPLAEADDLLDIFE